MVMPPTNILEVMSFRMWTRVTATVVCCILMQILCVVSQKASASGELRPPTGAPPLDLAGGLHPRGDFVPKSQTPYRVSAPGPRWGTSIPQTPSLLLCPPNNPVRSTPLPDGLSCIGPYNLILDIGIDTKTGRIPDNSPGCNTKDKQEDIGTGVKLPPNRLALSLS